MLFKCSENPSFIGYNHMCCKCVSFLTDCNHKCCHAWLISRANALGFSITKKFTILKIILIYNQAQKISFHLFDASNELNLLPTLKCSTCCCHHLMLLLVLREQGHSQECIHVHLQSYFKSRTLSALTFKSIWLLTLL